MLFSPLHIVSNPHRYHDINVIEMDISCILLQTQPNQLLLYVDQWNGSSIYFEGGYQVYPYTGAWMMHGGEERERDNTFLWYSSHLSSNTLLQCQPIRWLCWIHPAMPNNQMTVLYTSCNVSQSDDCAVSILECQPIRWLCALSILQCQPIRWLLYPPCNVNQSDDCTVYIMQCQPIRWLCGIHPAMSTNQMTVLYPPCNINQSDVSVLYPSFNVSQSEILH